ncbi:pentapeptide repeat-containing protein [Anabaena lutea]|uniref:Pentapeptide repeat-containing protein n=1 Tax=Anabaena lutea FACHB-196 TaxID=2692881 RepID=A0ABR8FKI9_9NOST|nr:pentapeptide repeat-containing protein [Anabaena lutea]MBD2570299.1 pentapeptide repeat-containing protein [Anabaena lutea FACHB-196]
MNTSDSELNLASLADRISQVEAEQNLRRKNIAWLKQYFDELKQEFNNRPELDQIQTMQQEIVQLTAQVAELQQCLNLSSNIMSEDLNEGENLTEIKTIDDAEIVKQFFERVERQQSQGVLIEKEVVIKNVDIDEIEKDEEVDVIAEESENSNAFKNLEFQIERIMWLVNRIYAAEEDYQDIPVSAEEFWCRYEAGERDFTGINLAGVNLSGKSMSYVSFNQANFDNANFENIKLSSVSLENSTLRKANLTGAHLYKIDIIGSHLSGANLSNANLRKARLIGSDLSNANLSSANLLEANLENANLEGVNLQKSIYNSQTIFPKDFVSETGAYLIAPGASLAKADLSGADLSQVNLTGANLSYSNLELTNMQGTDLSQANLSSANLTKANLIESKLIQANLRFANLSEANLSSANLTAANLISTNLIQTALNSANLTAAGLSGANLTNANWCNYARWYNP